MSPVASGRWVRWSTSRNRGARGASVEVGHQRKRLEMHGRGHCVPRQRDDAHDCESFFPMGAAAFVGVPQHHVVGLHFLEGLGRWGPPPVNVGQFRWRLVSFAASLASKSGRLAVDVHVVVVSASEWAHGRIQQDPKGPRSQSGCPQRPLPPQPPLSRGTGLGRSLESSVGFLQGVERDGIDRDFLPSCLRLWFWGGSQGGRAGEQPFGVCLVVREGAGALSG